MNEFTCKIAMDNAAFEADPDDELGRILHKVTYAVRNGVRSGVCRDAGGERVGFWEVR